MTTQDNHTLDSIIPNIPLNISPDMTEYNDLLIAVEILLINHGLLDQYHFEDVKHYKFMTPELKTLKDELIDRYKHNEQPVIQALWDKYPTLYGKLRPKAHSNLQTALRSAKELKARVYTYNKFNQYIGSISATGKPLLVLVNDVILDMETVRSALDG